MAPITKRPYLKRQKKPPTLVPVPQAAAPVPVHLIAVNKAVSSSSQRMTNHITLAVARAPVEKKSPHVLPAAPAPALAVAPTPFPLDEPIHLCGILVKIVGTEMSCQGCLCKEHKICSEVLKEDVVVCLHKMQLMVEGKEGTAIMAIWVMDGINSCHIGFVPCHMVTVQRGACAGHLRF